MLQCYSVTMCPLCANCSTWPLHQICDYTRVACKHFWHNHHRHHDPHPKTSLYLSFAMHIHVKIFFFKFSSSFVPSVSKKWARWWFEASCVIMQHNFVTKLCHIFIEHWEKSEEASDTKYFVWFSCSYLKMELSDLQILW